MANIVKGTVFTFEENIFTGSHRKPKFSHTETHTVEVVDDSYGGKRGQHSFKLKVIESDGRQAGEVFRKMGRNLYPTAVVITQPGDIDSKAEEKAKRAEAARAAKYHQWAAEAQMEGKHWKADKIPGWFKKENEHLFQ